MIQLSQSKTLRSENELEKNSVWSVRVDANSCGLFLFPFEGATQFLIREVKAIDRRNREMV